MTIPWIKIAFAWLYACCCFAFGKMVISMISESPSKYGIEERWMVPAAATVLAILSPLVVTYIWLAKLYRRWMGDKPAPL